MAPQTDGGGGSKFSCNALFVGRKIVHGNVLNDIGLSLIVTDLREGEAAGKSSGNGGGGKPVKVTEKDLRCNLEFGGDRWLHLTYIKKDEGFESDGESSTKSNGDGGSGSGAVASGGDNNHEEKVIKDHVFNDDSSASSGDEITSDKGASSSENSSQSASPTSDLLQKYKFDHKESYPIGDVLICHTDQEFRNCVVWVIRTKEQQLEAVVLECASEDEVKTLYRKFLEVSKRQKLERHRRRKSDGASGGGGGVVTRSVEALFSRNNKLRSEKTKSVHVPDLEKQQIASSNVPFYDHKRWNLVQHTDRNGVTHIEVENHNKAIVAAGNKQQPNSLSVITMAKDQTEQQAPVVGIKSRSGGISSKKSEKSKFAKELESILSKELESRRTSDNVKPGQQQQQQMSSPSTTTVLSSQQPISSSGAIPRVRPPHGESLSLRQRAPALLLRKLDEFEEKAQRVWAKAEAAAAAQEEEENRKVWNRVHPSKMASRTPPPKRQEHWPGIGGGHRFHRHHHQQQPQPLSQQQQQSSPKVSQATSPQQQQQHRLHTSSSSNSSTPVTVTKKQQQQSQQQQSSPASNEKQILIPTKTGKEPPKKLYPKEANPEMMLRQHQAAAAAAAAMVTPRFVHLAPMDFTTAAAAVQPHSLPIYPVQLTSAPIAWARYPAPPEFSPAAAMAAAAAAAANDPNNNLQQILQAQQWAAITPPTVTGGGSVAARGRSRDRVRLDPEHRRRAQSKSPARQKSHDNNTDFSGGISRKFRELGDVFRQKMGRGSKAAPPFNIHDSVDGGHPLKSNLKKFGGGGESGEQQQPQQHQQHQQPQQQQQTQINGGNDNKKVHFNKFATVQMME